MRIPPRTLLPGQSCQVWIHDTETGSDRLVIETRDRLLEAPNWTLQDDALILNGDGLIWRISLSDGEVHPVAIADLPPVNNDHVLDPDGTHIFLSTYDDWQIYRAPLAGGRAAQISGKDGPPDFLHFLHGVSPDGRQLAFVGAKVERSAEAMKFVSAEICTMDADGGTFRQLTHGGTPSDGPEYSPDGAWIYLNTEAFSGHAQIGRMRPDGSDLSRLTFSDTVDWFPHLAPDGKNAAYLAYPSGTKGHPGNLWVELMVVRDNDWQKARCAVRLFGGQGTINVNSWSPDSRQFAYVAYPMD